MALARMVIGSVLLACVVGTVHAQPVIPPGQEERVLGLFAPLGLGSERDGWTLDGVAIERGVIELRVVGGDGRTTLRLHHPDARPAARERTASFAVEREGADPSVLDPWVAALRANDDGTFWPVVQAEPRGAARAPSSPSSPSTPPWPWLGSALALVLALGLVLASERGKPMTAPTVSAPVSMRRRAAMALGLGAAFSVFALFLIPAPPLHSDTLRDLFLARHCLETGRCFGADTSFGGLVQHAGWVRLLATLRGAGVGPVGVHRVVLALHGLAIVAIQLAASTRLRPAPALAATGLAMLLSLWAAGLPLVWNPSLLPVAHGLLFAGLLRAAPGRGSLGRDASAALLGGLGATLAIEAHVVGAVALAPLVFGLRLGANRPGLAVPLALGVVGALELVFSGAGVATNLAAPVFRGAGLPLLVLGLGVAWALGAQVARRWNDHRWIATLAFALVVGLLPAVAIVALGHFLQIRYFGLALVPAALLGGRALQALVDRGVPRGLASAAALAALTALGLDVAAQRFGQVLDFADAERITEALAAQGSPEETFLALRGPEAGLLAGTMMLDAATDAIRWRPGEALRLVPGDDPPPGWERIATSLGGLLLGPTRSWLRLDEAEVCFVAGDEPTCVALRRGDWARYGGDTSDGTRFVADHLPRLQRAREELEADVVEVFVRVPVTVTEPGPRFVRTLRPFSQQGHWSVVRAEGLALEIHEDGREAELRGDPGARGTVTFAWSEPVGFLVPLLLFDVLEVGAGERTLMDAFCAEDPRCR